jgi:tetratricopeptide (TPR) repeat protein
VAAAWEEARSWQGQGRLPEALSAARRAAGLAAAGEADESLRRKADARVADLRLLERLEDVRLEYASTAKDELEGSYPDYKVGDGLYRGAFEDAGLPVEARPAQEAAAQVRGTTVAAELAAALDEWAWQRRELCGPADPSWQHLLRVARAADPDPWRVRLREALERGDGPALADLAGGEEAFGLRPATLSVLASALEKQGAAGQALALRRETRRRHPNDYWANAELGLMLMDRKPPEVDEAIRFFTAAVAVRPRSPGAHLNLGAALRDKGRLEEAIAEHQEALRLKEDFATAHNSLGLALHEKGDLDGAVAAYRAAVGINKGLAAAHNNLGNALHEKGDVDGAVAAYQEAIGINKGYAKAHYNLGNALRDKGDVDGAVAAYRAAIGINKDFAEAHCNLGNALRDKGDGDGAIAEYRAALRINNDLAEAHGNLGAELGRRGDLDGAIAEFRATLRIHKDDVPSHHNLGLALHEKGDLDGAIAAYRAAIRINKDYPGAHYDLGNALKHKGDVDGAIAEYQEAIRLNKDHAEAHCNLGHLLRDKGQFAEALTYLRRGHELGSKGPGWRYPSAQWVKECERLAELDGGKLPAILSGQEQPASATERVSYARLCQFKRRHAGAARLYREAFAAQPALVASPDDGLRYDAACAAALAGCGTGADAAALTDAERAGFRQQARDWLRADLDALCGLLNKDPDKARPMVTQKMRHWLRDPDLAGVRGPDALAKLPEAERAGWRQLWADVAETLRRAADKPPQPRDGGKKP